MSVALFQCISFVWVLSEPLMFFTQCCLPYWTNRSQFLRACGRGVSNVPAAPQAESSPLASSSRLLALSPSCREVLLMIPLPPFHTNPCTCRPHSVSLASTSLSGCYFQKLLSGLLAGSHSPLCFRLQHLSPLLPRCPPQVSVADLMALSSNHLFVLPSSEQMWIYLLILSHPEVNILPSMC